MEVIYSYTEEQAIEDGVLIEYPHKKGWCCTRTVWEELPEKDDEGKMRHLGAIIVDAFFETRRVFKQKPDEWLVASGRYVKESGYWLARNSLGGITIMKPEDY
ncbi:MAG: hypothetical protein Q7T03_03640 [Deltaproteobacteria bacterium]|nr:hypothetical protein [Deltaproteobacteria bacterium]